jgi:hypothetical protein
MIYLNMDINGLINDVRSITIVPCSYAFAIDDFGLMIQWRSSSLLKYDARSDNARLREKSSQSANA